MVIELYIITKMGRLEYNGYIDQEWFSLTYEKSIEKSNLILKFLTKPFTMFLIIHI